MRTKTGERGRTQTVKLKYTEEKYAKWDLFGLIRHTWYLFVPSCKYLSLICESHFVQFQYADPEYYCSADTRPNLNGKPKKSWRILEYGTDNETLDGNKGVVIIYGEGGVGIWVGEGGG